ncbi:MAG: hypothetical protein ACJ0Q3_01525 [Candidatus Azotimanducaceae bacterium]
MDFLTLKQTIFWLCAVSGIMAVTLMPISVLFHHFQNQKEERIGLLKELFWLLIAGLMILFMVFPAGQQMLDDYLGNKMSLNRMVGEGVGLNATLSDPIKGVGKVSSGRQINE